MWEYVYWWIICTMTMAVFLTLHGYAFDHKDNRLPFILNVSLVVLMQISIVVFLGVAYLIFIIIPQWLFGV